MGRVYAAAEEITADAEARLPEGFAERRLPRGDRDKLPVDRITQVRPLHRQPISRNQSFTDSLSLSTSSSEIGQQCAIDPRNRFKLLITRVTAHWLVNTVLKRSQFEVMMTDSSPKFV